MSSRVHAAAWLLVGATACGDNAPTATCPTGGVHACGSQLRDAEGRAWILRGVNFAGVHKNAPYTDTFGPADYARLHAWGFRSLRYLFPWAAIEPAEGSYDDAYLEDVATHVRWAQDAGLSVILDMHQDVYGEGFGFDGAPRWTCSEDHYTAFTPRDPWSLNYTDANVIACFDHLWSDVALQASFSAMWAHVAARLAGAPNIIGFDPLNEPHWGSSPVAAFEPQLLQPFYVKVIDAVRAKVPWVVFAEPSGSRNLGFATKLRPFDVADVVYAPHLYDPSAELSGSFDQMHRDTLLSTAEDLRADADRLGVPLWIGEYGGIAASSQIGAYMDAAYDGAAAHLAGTTYWSYDQGGGYSILDAGGQPVAPLIDAIVRPYPERIAGEPIDWSYDDATRVLAVSWHPDPAITAPTIVVVPEHAYPTSFEVDCGGCAVERGDGEISLGPVAGEVARVTITPR